MQHTSDAALEDAIDSLTDKLAAFCFKHLEEVMNSIDANDVVDENTDQHVFEEELQVRF